MDSIDLGVKIKVLCPKCLRTLEAFVHSRYGKTVEICVEPHSCKREKNETRCLSCSVPLAEGETTYCEDCNEHIVKNHYRKEE